jgi:hypothetical protein
MGLPGAIAGYFSEKKRTIEVKNPPKDMHVLSAFGLVVTTVRGYSCTDTSYSPTVFESRAFCSMPNRPAQGHLCRIAVGGNFVA